MNKGEMKEERERYCNSLRHNRKLLKAGEMKSERMKMFAKLMVLMDENKHKNQYE